MSCAWLAARPTCGAQLPPVIQTRCCTRCLPWKPSLPAFVARSKRTTSAHCTRSSARRGTGCGKVRVDARRHVASLADGPDDERRAATDVAGGEHAFNGRAMGVVRAHGARGRQLHAELREQSVAARSREAHREQHEIGANREFGPWIRFEHRAPTRVVSSDDMNRVELTYASCHT